MRNKEIEEYKNGLLLSERQKEILVGLLLGDGHIERMYNPTTGRLKVEHSYKQKDYTDWLYKEFRKWVRSKPKTRKFKTWGKIRKNYRFCTYGSIKSRKHKGVFLNTQGFGDSDIKKLQKILKNKFQVDSTTRIEKNGKQIYLGGKSGERFIEIINPYIISSMRYKIPKVLRLTELPKT